MPKRNIHEALFDVRPKHDSGEFRAGKIVDLRVAGSPAHSRPVSVGTPRLQPRSSDVPSDTMLVRPQNPPESQQPSVSLTDRLIGKTPLASHKEIIAQEVEAALREEHLVADLVRSGGTIHASAPQTSA